MAWTSSVIAYYQLTQLLNVFLSCEALGVSQSWSSHLGSYVVSYSNSRLEQNEQSEVLKRTDAFLLLLNNSTDLETYDFGVSRHMKKLGEFL